MAGKSKQWRPRFSIGTLLWMTITAAILISWYRDRQVLIRRHDAVEQALKAEVEEQRLVAKFQRANAKRSNMLLEEVARTLQEETPNE